ncbi:MAG: hypothetical protein GX131_14735 [candidate division WS1 bacterium]|jgi:capsular polysaccharide biosynthesis protein|nr:hypothetical protein [candidate division WS1 bacterium]
MEFVEYYRILRRRIWLVVLTAGLAAAAVLLTRLLPQETVYPADGRILLHDVAKREMYLQGNDLFIGPLDNQGEFWNGFSQFVNSRYVFESAAAELGISSPEAEEALEPAQAERLGESDVARISASAVEVPQGEGVSVEDPREMATLFTNTVMDKLDDLWRQNRLARIDAIRKVLQERLPDIEGDLADLRANVDAIVGPYGGVPPTTLESQMTTELGTIESETSASEISRGTADARADILGERARSTGGGRTTTTPIQNPEAAALQQAIAQKQVELEEELTRRTAEHEAVKAIERQIAGLRQRLATVRTDAVTTGTDPGSIALREAAIQAEVEAAAINRRLDLLAQRATEIHNSLPQISRDARIYEEVDARLKGMRADYDAVINHLERLDYEEQQLEATTLIEVIAPAEAQRIPTGLASFVLKLIVAIIAGAILGILLVFAIYYVDFSFQDAHEAELLLEVPVLAGIPRTDVAGPTTQPAVAGPPSQGQDSDDDRGIL